LSSDSTNSFALASFIFKLTVNIFSVMTAKSQADVFIWPATATQPIC